MSSSVTLSSVLRTSGQVSHPLSPATDVSLSDSGSTMSEKVVRYMEDKLRQKDALVEKLRLKNATLKTQLKKSESKLKQKEEMGDVLHYIDFHQLQIENKQYVAKIEERNQELLKLKLTTGNTVQMLNTLKTELSDLQTDGTKLKKEIAAKQALLDKLRIDGDGVRGVINRSRRMGQVLQERADDTADMPEVLDYVKQKAEFEILDKDVKSWRRKVEIAEMGSSKTRRMRTTGGRSGKSAAASLR